MQHHLAQRVEGVRAAATRLAWAYGLGRFAAAAVATVIALGLLDFALRLHDPASRWLFSAIGLAAIVFAFAKLAWPALAFVPGLVPTAQNIERRFPKLGERLTSAISFLDQAETDPTAGSSELRRAVIAQAESLAADMDFRSALDRVPVLRALGLLGGASLLGIALFLINPLTATLAVGRLAMPWRNLAWPRQHELAFVDPPRRLATGDDLELTLIDRRGSLPDDAEILIRRQTANGWLAESKPMKPLGDRVLFRLDNVTHGLEYRARGGDDNTMPWTELAVVEPPRLIGLQIIVEPPPYTGLPKKSEGQLVKALVGSRLVLRGELDKPIRSARLKSETSDVVPPAVEVAASGRKISAPAGGGDWLVERSGVFRIELIDEEGTPYGRDMRVELQAIEDTPPAIAWELPGDHDLVTSRAIIAVKGSVKDDLAVRGVQLRYLRPGTSDEEQIIEIDAPPAVPSAAGQVDQRLFQSAWDLSPLSGLTPGDVLAVRVTAEDSKSQFTTTPLRRLTIIAPEELEGRLATRQSAILSQLADALRLAQQCDEQIAALSNSLTVGRVLSRADNNRLQAIQYNHQQVQQLLAANREGAEGQLAALLEELVANRSQNDASLQRLGELRTQVRSLNEGPLPIVDQELAEATKAASATPPEPSSAERSGAAALELASRLDKAGQQEHHVVETLEKMVGALSQWDSLSRIAREIGQIRSDEQRIASDTDERIAKSVATVTAAADSDHAAVRQLSQSQLALGRRLDKLQARMEGMLQSLTQQDPPTAALLADGIDTARRLAIGGQMREIGLQLSLFQFSQARQAQQRAIDDLEHLINALSTRRDADLARRLSALRQAGDDLRMLAQRGARAESDLANSGAGLSTAPRAKLEQLRRELEQLAAASQQLGRRLERLQSPRASALVDRAAASGLAAARSSAAGQQAEAQQQAGDARQKLEEAQAALANAVADLEERLANEQLADAGQAIAGLAARQKNVLLETERLQTTRDRDGQLPATQQGALKNAASEQRLLADETDGLRPRLSAPAFAFALETAAAHMRRATSLLERGKTSAPTQDAAKSALSRLQQVLEVLREDRPKTEDQSSPPAGQPGANSSKLAQRTGELKLLKFLQEEINRRTSEIESRLAGGAKLSDDEQLELESLAGEQGRLADMILGLIETKAQSPDVNENRQTPREQPQETNRGRDSRTLNSPRSHSVAPASAPSAGPPTPPEPASAGLSAFAPRFSVGYADSFSSMSQLQPASHLWLQPLASSAAGPSIFTAQTSPSAGKSRSDNRSLDQQLLDDLDRELLKDLPAAQKPAQPKSPAKAPPADAAPTAPDSQNPLVQIAEQMRSIQQRIARRDTSAETQERQTAIVKSLQSLLDQANSKIGDKQSGGGSAQPGIGTGEAIAGPPRDSTNRIERGSPEPAETADVKDLLRRTWGHLPPKIRDAMQTSISEKFLPKYERLIEEYYKRLAEERPLGP